MQYDPEGDDRNAVKDYSWDELMDGMENVTGRLLKMGDLNSQVRALTEESIKIQGKYREKHENNNEHRISAWKMI